MTVTDQNVFVTCKSQLKEHKKKQKKTERQLTLGIGTNFEESISLQYRVKYESRRNETRVSACMSIEDPYSYCAVTETSVGTM